MRREILPAAYGYREGRLHGTLALDLGLLTILKDGWRAWKATSTALSSAS